jgi:alkylation response protein AidB-like acyl-CoA dehydrogenase
MTIPEEYGSHGLGITEATLLLEEIARSGGAMNAARTIHLSIFGMQPVVMHAKKTGGMMLFLTRIKQVRFNQSRRRETPT